VSDRIGRENTMVIAFFLQAVCLLGVLALGRTSSVWFTVTMALTFFTWGEIYALFPATAVLGPLVYEPAPASLIGDEAESFELAATANGTATAVDVSQVEAIAEERLLAGIAAGAQLVPGSVEVSIGAPVITGSVVTFPVTATASQIRPVDAEDLEAEILGLSIEQAEAALARYGAVTIEVWPDLVTSIPTNDSRVTITVVGGVTPSAAPSSPPP